MSDYRRLISYIYAYEGGEKGKNIGFAKIDMRGPQCRIQVNVKKVYVGSSDIGVYLLHTGGEVLLGRIFIRSGAGEFRTQVQSEDVDGTGIRIEDCYGLTIHDMENAWQSYTTIWEDAVAQTAEIQLAEVTAEHIRRQQEERMQQERKQQERKQQEQKQQEQEQKATGQAEQPQQLDLFEEKLLEPKNRIRHKLIGQLFDTYWLVEFNEHLYIIDQHAAHEKVLYEKTMRTLKTREFTSQMLNPPIILTIGSTEEVLLKKYMKYFQDIGFEIEPFGGREYAVRAVPDNLFSVAKKELLMEMIDDLSEDAGARTADMIHDRVATMSCKAAVKGNNHLSFAEADHLIDELLNLDNPYACPHGRPTIISMSRYELEKKFKRIV